MVDLETKEICKSTKAATMGQARVLVVDFRRGFQEKALHTSNSRNQDTPSWLYG